MGTSVHARPDPTLSDFITQLCRFPTYDTTERRSLPLCALQLYRYHSPNRQHVMHRYVCVQNRVAQNQLFTARLLSSRKRSRFSPAPHIEYLQSASALCNRRGAADATIASLPGDINTMRLCTSVRVSYMHVDFKFVNSKLFDGTFYNFVL